MLSAQNIVLGSEDPGTIIPAAIRKTSINWVQEIVTNRKNILMSKR
jgi:hypothetical protein